MLLDRNALRIVIEVENFGPLNEAFIETARTTVLIGPYNTGKTYLATLIYLIAITVNSIWSIVSPFDILRRNGVTGYFVGEEARKLLRTYVDELKDDWETNSKNYLQFNFSRELTEHYAIFSPAELIREGYDYSSIRASILSESSEEYIRFEFIIKKDGQINIDHIGINQSLLNYYIDSVDRIHIDEFGGGSISWKGGLPSLFEPLYVPAERFFIMTNMLQLTQLIAMTHGAKFLGPDIEAVLSRSLKYSMKPLILTYIVKLLSAFREQNLRKSLGQSVEYSDLVKHLLDGSVEFDERSLTIYYLYKDRLKIPISRASSGVAQLSGLCLPLQYSNYSFAVIEEPEMNLHPNYHLRVAEFLAEISKHSPILITTHSDFLMAKLSHLWAKGEISSFKAYFLDPDEHRTIELEVEETGEIELPRTIDEAIQELDSEILELMGGHKEE